LIQLPTSDAKVNCTDELRAIPNLIQALKARFPRSHVRLLVLLDYQDRATADR
jgi:hypothetical protein